MKKRGRKPVLVTIDLPMPPASQGSAHGDWLANAIGSIRSADLQSVPGVVSIKVLPALTEEQRDISEISRAVVAVLVKENIIADDVAVVDTVARWDRTIPEGQVRVVVKRTTPPAQRIGSETRQRVVRLNRSRCWSPKTEVTRPIAA